MHRIIHHGRGSGLGLKAADAERGEDAASQGFFLYELLAIGASVADFIEAAIVCRRGDYHILSPPLLKYIVI